MTCCPQIRTTNCKTLWIITAYFICYLLQQMTSDTTTAQAKQNWWIWYLNIRRPEGGWLHLRSLLYNKGYCLGTFHPERFKNVLMLLSFLICIRASKEAKKKILGGESFASEQQPFVSLSHFIHLKHLDNHSWLKKKQQLQMLSSGILHYCIQYNI